jgi:hypothetical protein
VKFDGTLTTKNWVEFILNLRNNEATNFGLAYETIKYESKTRYWFKTLPEMSSEEYVSWKNTLEADIYKKQMTNIMDQCGKYDEACNKACELLMSSKYMPEFCIKVSIGKVFSPGYSRETSECSITVKNN